MSEIKTRADFVDAVAKMVRMCDEAGLLPTWKQQGFLCTYVGGGMPEIPPVYSAVEFPLAILEGRPVFVGDEVFSIVGDRRIKVNEFDGHNIYGKDALNGQNVVHAKGFLSWNPPKPRTVMVEMLREDAEDHAAYRYSSASLMRLSEACRKALESSK